MGPGKVSAHVCMLHQMIKDPAFIRCLIGMVAEINAEGYRVLQFCKTGLQKQTYLHTRFEMMDSASFPSCSPRGVPEHWKC